MDTKKVLKTAGWMFLAYTFGKASGMVNSRKAVDKVLMEEHGLTLKSLNWYFFKPECEAEIIKLVKEVEES